jgi:hypothetical protein
MIVTPQLILSQKLIKPYTNAELSTLVPIRSAVIDRPLTIPADDPPPKKRKDNYFAIK